MTHNRIKGTHTYTSRLVYIHALYIIAFAATMLTMNTKKIEKREDEERTRVKKKGM